MSNPRVGSGGQIADDVLREVFARLPDVQDLLRCAVTCWRWRRLITDPAENAHRPSMLAGIFTQNIWLDRDKVEPLKGKPRSPPKFLSLQAGSAHANLTSFVADDDGLFNDARPLASRRGFLLLGIMLPANTDHRHKLRLAVCRPLIDNRTHLLPSPPIDLPGISDSPTGWAILTSADHTALKYQGWQVLVTYRGYGVVFAYMYYPATRSWSVPIKYQRDLTRCGPGAGVVARGVVHWLYRDYTELYTLNISATMKQVSLTKIPIKIDAGLPYQRPPLLCITGEGTLSLFNTQDDGVPELWTKQKQDDRDHHIGEGEGRWLHSYLANLRTERPDIAFFAESKGALLIEQGGALFIFDLKSREKVRVTLKCDEIDQATRWFPAILLQL
ncbi:hypothetical protein CFC21_025027 [Triticum aestivum]|uniref:F-box domain-containing protein n=2 Tax=Triticum aestivum TaxID=4565 RepID=A0A3B6CBK7_WHEAT|nr:uncharacterized protein LOC119361087 [Triticum dicoccoides]KAF7010631.1 hypothetical protein CFC21_025027 [Triticum aestivum]